MDKSNRRIGTRGFLRSGNMNPSEADASTLPTLIVCTRLEVWKAVFTPVNVSVAVLAPDPMVIELVPDPVHGTVERQVKVPLDVSTVLKTTLPFGRTVNGSALATPADTIEETMNGRMIRDLM